MFIARKPFPPPASFGGADTLLYSSAEVCPLLRTKQSTVAFGRYKHLTPPE